MGDIRNITFDEYLEKFCGANLTDEQKFFLRTIGKETNTHIVFPAKIGRTFLFQNCNNKLHTFAPHHTCGVMS